MDLPAEVATGHVCVKEAVLPFDRFAGTDVLLGPEMRSTGEVMGIARDFPTAFAKAQAAAGARLPTSGTVFITVADRDKSAATGIAIQLHDLGFKLLATRGTAKALDSDGHSGADDQQAERGLPARRRGDRERGGRPRDQHAGRAPARARTATRSGPRRWRTGSRASRRCRAVSRPSERSPRRRTASRLSSRCRSCTRSRRRPPEPAPWRPNAPLPAAHLNPAWRSASRRLRNRRRPGPEPVARARSRRPSEVPFVVMEGRLDSTPP